MCIRDRLGMVCTGADGVVHGCGGVPGKNICGKGADMTKVKLGARNSLYPSLTTLVGTVVDGRHNFITIAHVGIMTMNLISFGIGKTHFSNQGIRENGSFSVNIPSEELVVRTD